jgi:hypothetical protein
MGKALAILTNFFLDFYYKGSRSPFVGNDLPRSSCPPQIASALIGL